jgi:hypothetical protein
MAQMRCRGDILRGGYEREGMFFYESSIGPESEPVNDTLERPVKCKMCDGIFYVSAGHMCNGKWRKQ